MNTIWVLLLFPLHLAVSTEGLLSMNVPSRPAVVNIGAVFTFDSSIGRVANLAIQEAVNDVNSDSTILPGTELVVHMQNANCSGFLGLIGALKFMETEVVAVIGPQSSVVAHMISHIANELQRPLLSFAATDPTLSSLQFPFFLRTTQSDFHQMSAIADIVDYYGWRQVVAVFIDDDYGRNGISALDDSLAARRCRISFKLGIPPGSGNNRSTVMDFLIRIQLSESRIIVVHAHPDVGLLIFSVAHYLQMMNEGFVWIATDWLSSVLDTLSPALPSETMETIQGVLMLRQFTPDSDGKKAFLSRWNNLTGGSFGLNSYGLYAYDTVWLVARAVNSFIDRGGVISFSKDPKLGFGGDNFHLDTMKVFNGGSLLMNYLLESNFTGLSGQFKFGPDRSLVRPAYDVINVIGNGVRRVGYWSNHTGLSTLPPETVINNSNSDQRLFGVIWPGQTTVKPRGWVFPSNGKLLRIGVPNRVSYREFVSQARGTDNFKGFCIEVFQAAVNLLPYAVPYEFIPFGDGKENPSYRELVNLVATGFFDAAVGDIAIVTNRTKIVDFTQPYASSGLVVTTSFRKLNSGAWAFLRPFSPLMWGVTASFFLFIGVVIWILEHRLNDEFRGTPKEQFITILWFSLSTLFFSHRETTVSTLGRAVLIIWLFVVLIVNSSYTASLTSILTVQQLSSPVKGIEDLKRSNDRIGYQVGSFAQHYLIEEIGIPKSRLIELGKPEDYARALQLGPNKEGGVIAIVDERPYIDLFLSNHCKFRIVGHEFTKSGWGFAFPRDSTLAVDISTAILKLSENGDLQRIHDKWLPKSSCSSDGSELESDELHLSSFAGLFLICLIACFTALVVYFLQLFSRYRRFTREEESLEEGSSGGGGTRSRRVQTLLILMDEKKSIDRRTRDGSSQLSLET